MKSKDQVVVIDNTNFILEKKLGEGNRGAVYLAYEPGNSNEKICIKKEDSRDRAHQEVAAIEKYYPQFQKTGIDETTEKGAFYFAMPYFKGTTLKDALKKGLTIFEKLVIAYELKKQLDNLHDKGILHRDIKADNIMVNIENGKIEVNIIDLGRSVMFDVSDQDDKNQENLKLKTPKISLAFQPQAAPEYLDKAKKIGKHSDIYSYGKIFKSLFPEARIIIEELTDRNALQKRGITFSALNNSLTSMFNNKKLSILKECEKWQLNLKNDINRSGIKGAMDDLINNLNIATYDNIDSLQKVSESFNKMRKCFKSHGPKLTKIEKLFYDFIAFFGIPSERSDYRKLKQKCIESFVKIKEQYQEYRVNVETKEKNNPNEDHNSARMNDNN